MVQPKYTYELNHKIPESENSGRVNQVSPGLMYRIHWRLSSPFRWLHGYLQAP